MFSWKSLGVTPCGKPARAGRLDRIGGRRTLHVSRFNPRLTNQANNEKHGASLLFSIPKGRLTNQTNIETRNLFFLRKEVIQPQVPLRLPCYDLVPIRSFIFGACLSAPATSDAPPFGGLTGGVYKAQEHIHRGSADPRLLAIPTSCTRIAECNLNWGTVFAI